MFILLVTHHFQSNNRLTQRLPGKGDVVIIKDNLRKRPVWRLGLITDLHTSEDGQVRSATVRMGSRTTVTAPPIFIRRPLLELYLLELDEQKQQQPVIDISEYSAIDLSVDLKKNYFLSCRVA